MPLKTGVDIVAVDRINKLSSKVIEMMFHKSEIGNSEAMHLAGIIAAKEAFFKALGEKPRWLDIEVKNNDNGRPYFVFNSALKQKIKEVDVSISHDKEYAVASVVMLVE